MWIDSDRNLRSRIVVLVVRRSLVAGRMVLSRSRPDCCSRFDRSLVVAGILSSLADFAEGTGCSLAAGLRRTAGLAERRSPGCCNRRVLT